MSGYTSPSRKAEVLVSRFGIHGQTGLNFLHVQYQLFCVEQAFCLARTGRPGPVLIDVPKDVQQQLAVPDWNVAMAIEGYLGRLPPPPRSDQISAVIDALQQVQYAALQQNGTIMLLKTCHFWC